MNYNFIYGNIYEMKKEMKLVIRECLCLNQENIDWNYHIKQWRNKISPLFSKCENIMEGIRIIDPLFKEMQFDEERRKMEEIFYLILTNVCETPSCVSKSQLTDALILMEEIFYLILTNICKTPSCVSKNQLTDALILFYWCKATNLCYYSLNELVASMTRKGSKKC